MLKGCSFLTDLCPTHGVAPCRWNVGSYAVDEQWECPPLKVVAMMARHSCRPATPVGLMLLTCGLSPHSQRVGCCIDWMAEKLKCLACRALPQSWVLNGHFSFPLWYKQRGEQGLTLLFSSLVSWDGNHLSPPLILKLALLPHPQWLVGVTMADIPTAAAPTVITISHCSVMQGWMPPPVGHRHRPGESLL
jgi:hypothetical protein